jgi:hypothetical protein
VIFARNPSRTVTGAPDEPAAADEAPAGEALDVPPGLLEVAEEQPVTRTVPPTAMTATAMAAGPARILRIYVSNLDRFSRLQVDYTPDRQSRKHCGNSCNAAGTLCSPGGVGGAADRQRFLARAQRIGALEACIAYSS